MDREPDDLRGDAQRMLAMWRDAQDMPADARARVRRRLEAHAEPSVARTSTRTWTIAFALAAAIVLAWWVSTLGDHRAQAQRDPAREQASDRAQGDAPAIAPTPAELPQTPAEPPSIEPPSAAPAIDPAPVQRPRATSSPTPEITASTLAREKALIQQAWETVATGDPAGALRVVDTHAREFPEGVLAPERRAVAIVARCKRGDADAKERAQKWLATDPRSVHAARVRSACEIDGTP